MTSFQQNNEKPYDYFLFWNLLKQTSIYRKIREDSTKSLQKNVFFTEFLFLLFNAISGFPDYESIRNQIRIIFFLYKVTKKEKDELCNAIKASNLDYDIPSKEFLKNHIYDEKLNRVVKKCRFDSWILDENAEWQPPIKYPNDGKIYHWDDENKNWIYFKN